jgi:hypothetical protein
VNDILFLQEIEMVLPEFQPVDMVQVADLSLLLRKKAKPDASGLEYAERNLQEIGRRTRLSVP